jgi:SOS response regulatory protein OraA/RecX
MSGSDSCRTRALRLLAGRSHFRAELSRKLTTRGFPRAEVEATLSELVVQGHLDDERTAGELVRERRERRGWGRARLQAELQRRGAPAAAVSAALAGIGDEEELMLARQAALRVARRGAVEPAALGRHLARKGFSHHAILAVLAELGGAEGADIDDLEGNPEG